MKIMVTGYGGQLGYDVVKQGVLLGYDMIGTTSEVLNIVKQDCVERFVINTQPDVIIHCAAYTAVDKAEEDRETCYDINVNGTKYLVNAAKKVNAKFIYISTDYVFNGEGHEPLKEDNETNPIGYYGLTKLLGEETVKKTTSQYFNVRISWVFGKNGNNFVKTMLRLAEIKKEINVVGDQIGSPTYTYDLATLLLEMAQSDKYGTYHVSNEGFCSWAEFAEKIFDKSNIRSVKVNAISTEEYPTKAKRPKNSRMSKEKLKRNGFTPLRNWEEAVNHFLNEERLEG